MKTRRIILLFHTYDVRQKNYTYFYISYHNRVNTWVKLLFFQGLYLECYDFRSLIYNHENKKNSILLINTNNIRLKNLTRSYISYNNYVTPRWTILFECFLFIVKRPRKIMSNPENAKNDSFELPPIIYAWITRLVFLLDNYERVHFVFVLPLRSLSSMSNSSFLNFWIHSRQLLCLKAASPYVSTSSRCASAADFFKL